MAANPFDRFDQPQQAGNPFDQFDQPQPAAPQPPASSPNFLTRAWDAAKQGGSPLAAAFGIGEPAVGRFAEEAIIGAFDPVVGAGQMIGVFPDEDVKRREAMVGQTGAGRVLGNVMSPANVVGGAPVKLLSKAWAAANPVKAAVVGSTAGGAALSAMAPTTDEDFWTEKAKQAGIGAAIGAPAGAVGAVIGGAGASPAAKRLMAEGIQPTVGQSLGGWVNRAEQKLSSMPGLGDIVSYARNRPLREFEEKIIKDATRGANVKNLDEANDYVSGLYKLVLPNLPKHNLTPTVAQSARTALANPELTPANRDVVERVLRDRFANYHLLEGEQLKHLDADLGALIRKYSRSADVSHSAIADSLKTVQGAMRDLWRTKMPQHTAAALDEANAVYRNLVPVNTAASQRADRVVMPRALERAVAKQSGTMSSKMRGTVSDATQVLPSTVADSGTAGRILLPGTVASGFTPQAITGALIGGAGAARPVQRLLSGGYADTDLALAIIDALRRAAPAATRTPKDETK